MPTCLRNLVLAALCLTILASSIVLGQSEEDRALKEGAWALQFGIGGNFTLTTIQGATLGAQYHTSGSAALRGGITLSGSTSGQESTVEGFTADTSTGSHPDKYYSTDVGVSLILQRVWYMNSGDPVHFYLALGPSVSYSINKYSRDYSSFSGPYWYHSKNTAESTRWGIGAIGGMGVEWFANNWLSLRAEYGQGLERRWGTENATSSNRSDYPYSTSNSAERSGTTEGWFVMPVRVTLGLNVYW